MALPIAFDLEGPLVNPAIDFARLTYDSLISKQTKETYPDPFDRFDSYDDARWLAERRNGGRRHATGTTPLVVDCMAAVDGLTDADLISFADALMSSGRAYNPGAQQMLGRLAQASAYIITSSYPAIPLRVATENCIPLRNVYNHGNQESNGQISSVRHEVEHRSPMKVLSNNRKELAEFLHRYLDICDAVHDALKSGRKAAIHAAIEAHDRLFSSIGPDDLRSELAYMFLFESAIMGGHGKARAARKVGPQVITVGDGIVDADMLEGPYGVSINCTSPEALRASSLNVATERWDLLADLFCDMQQGRTKPADLKGGYDSGLLKVSTREDVERDFDGIVAANKAAKTRLKSLYTLPVAV